MKLIRTPDERFDNLPGYPFTPNYVEVPVKVKIRRILELIS